MNDRFFKDTITLFILNDKTEKLERIVLNKVYFRHNTKTITTGKGEQRASTGSITIPTKLNSIEISSDTIYVVEGIAKDSEYTELVQNYNVFRVISLSDNRKGNLPHFKLEVGE